MLNIKNTTDGYLKNIEIKGNTIQDAENLADIRSVGDKVEGQELYEIPVVSCGKNLFDGVWENGSVIDTGLTTTGYKEYARGVNFIPIKPNKNYIISHIYSPILYQDEERVAIFDKNKKLIQVVKVMLKTFTTPNNACYLIPILRGVNNPIDLTQLPTLQIEEGTQATPYEPYQEDKLTILSPVQLEKVGDVRDRIICKDGVWGVEKNIETVILDGSEDWKSYNSGTQTTHKIFRTALNGYTAKNKDDVLPLDIMSSKFKISSFVDIYNLSDDLIGTRNTENYIYIKSTNQTLEDLKSWLKSNNTIIKYQLAEPQFIPLPHDQQIKLRTFAGQTNIHFETEIEGTIKAQVPKSLGATVNTHTEQIGNLSKELDRVKKLEESTVSTVVTESDFTTVEETSNGYFEDMKLEGKTLVNLSNSVNVTRSYNQAISYETISNIQIGKLYTLIVKVDKNTCDSPLKFSSFEFCGGTNGVKLKDAVSGDYAFCPANTTGVFALKVGVEVYGENGKGTRLVIFNNGATVGEYTVSCLLLEGDHTQNPPSYFEGLMSVGEDVEEISVESVGTNAINLNSAECEDTLTTITIDNNILTLKTTASNSAYVYIKCLLGKDIEYTLNMNINTNPQHIRLIDSDKSTTLKVFSMGTNMNEKFNVSKTGYYYLRFTINPNIEYIIKNLCIYIKDMSLDYKQDKKPLLYYNNETQTWEKPVLRQWDSIEKHADGKYYYHKRSREVVLNGSESWEIGNGLGDTFIRFYTQSNLQNVAGDTNGQQDVTIELCDKFTNKSFESVPTSEFITVWKNAGASRCDISISKSKLSTQDAAGFKAWLQANPTTVVYQLAQEEVYECTNIDLITYNGETNYIVSSGAIAPKSVLKVHNNISNVVKILQEKVSLLESNVKASQEVQDMMILESDMRILDIELALMEFMPITLNLGENTMLRSATYFNFLKNHIVNETYEKEYLENVMNKYLATNRLTQEEYDELYKLLYPPVYDIELPIEY